MAARDAELLKKDLELYGLVERAKKLEENTEEMEGQLRAAQAEKAQAVASFDKLKAEGRRRELERSRSVRELEGGNMEATKNPGEGSDQLEVRVERLEKRVRTMMLERGTVIPALIQALTHNDARTRMEVSRALTAATGKSYGTAQGRWEDWWKTHQSEYQLPPRR